MERYFMEAMGYGYMIFDRNRGRGKDLAGWAIATVPEAEIAQRIVSLLNADAARLERQGAVAS